MLAILYPAFILVTLSLENYLYYLIIIEMKKANIYFTKLLSVLFLGSKSFKLFNALTFVRS